MKWLLLPVIAKWRPWQDFQHLVALRIALVHAGMAEGVEAAAAQASIGDVAPPNRQGDGHRPGDSIREPVLEELRRRGFVLSVSYCAYLVHRRRDALQHAAV
jgi:hypothetical protein